MKSFKQFISESVNIAGDFTGNATAAVATSIQWREIY